MDDKEMIATLRLMSATHDGDKPRVRWTWDETRKGRARLIEDWPDETPVIARESKRWKGCLPAGYIAEMHNNLPRLLELAERGMSAYAACAECQAESRAKQEQIEALAAENRALQTDLNQARLALGAIWRHSLLPFDDRSRLKIQNIAYAYKYGSPKPGSEIAQWMEDER